MFGEQVQSTRAAQKRRTATRIVEAAAQLFAEHGFQSTTVRRIAAEAGVDDFLAEATPEAKLKLIKAINAQTHKDSRRELKVFLVTHVILIAIIVGIAAIAAAYGQRREALAEANMYA